MTTIATKQELVNIANSLYFHGIIKDFYIDCKPWKDLGHYKDCGLVWYDKQGNGYKIYANLKEVY